MSLKELNEARREAKALGIEGASKMKLAEVRDAIAAAKADANTILVGVGSLEGATTLHEPEVAAIIADAEDDRHFAETIAAEEDAQDTPEAAAAYERAMNPPVPAVIGACEGCGEAILADERHDSDEAGMWCESCMVMPEAGVRGVEVAEAKGDGTDPEDEPRADCTDPGCAEAATVRDAVETRETARTRLIAEDPHENRAVLDVRQGGGEFRHLAIPGLHVTVCMKARPTATARTGSLNSVDCIECLDRLVETLARA